MRTIIALFTILSFGVAFGQTKFCPSPNGPVSVTEEPRVSKYPEVPDFDGSFQIEIVQGDQVAMTPDFLNYIASVREDQQEVVIDLGNNRVLRVSPRSALNQYGLGPFETAFIEK